LEHLSEASFLGKLLVLPAAVRQDWKVIARCKHSNLFGLIVSYKGKKFYNIDTRLLCLQTHPVNMMHFAELFQEQVKNFHPFDTWRKDQLAKKSTCQKVSLPKSQLAR
jgi:hypothetical protein